MGGERARQKKDNGEKRGRVRRRKHEARSRARDGESDERVKLFQIPLASLWVSNLLGLLGLQGVLTDCPGESLVQTTDQH